MCHNKNKVMPEFETYVDVYVDEMWSACSKKEKEELIELLVDEGYVKRVTQRDTEPEKGKSLMEIEWDTMIDKLSDLRQRVSAEEEEILKNIVSKYF